MKATIRCAADLIPLLHNVRPYHWRGHYQYKADAPCHESVHGESFMFGDDDRGRLRVFCWKYGCSTKVIGEALNARIITGGKPPKRDDPDRNGKYIPPPAVEYRRLPAEQAGGRRITVGDVLELPRWFPSRNKKGWATERAEGLYIWKQSVAGYHLDKGIDGIRAAAEGITHWDVRKERNVIVPRQHTYTRIDALIKRQRYADGVIPALALGGSAGYPYPFPLLVVDADYKPAKDIADSGREARDWIRSQLEALHAPMFPSSSGNGWHALMLLDDWDVVHCAVSGKQDCVHPIGHGLSFDIFLPGAPNLVALRMYANGMPDLDQPLPTVQLTDLDAIVDAYPKEEIPEHWKAESWKRIARKHAVEPPAYHCTCQTCARSGQ